MSSSLQSSQASSPYLAFYGLKAKVLPLVIIIHVSQLGCGFLSILLLLNRSRSKGQVCGVVQSKAKAPGFGIAQATVWPVVVSWSRTAHFGGGNRRAVMGRLIARPGGVNVLPGRRQGRGGDHNGKELSTVHGAFVMCH